MASRIVVAILLGACSGGSRPEPPSAPTTTISQPARVPVVGNWALDLPNDERYLLHVFASGIVGFQHVDPNTPIGIAYGRWTLTDDTLELAIVATEPEGWELPISPRLAVIVGPDATILTLDTSTWRAHDTYGKERAGWEARAADDERSWTSRVDRAPTGAAP